MHIVVNYPCLSPSKRRKVEQAHLLSLYCPKVSQSSPLAGGESSGIIFSGGVYVGEIQLSPPVCGSFAKADSRARSGL